MILHRLQFAKIHMCFTKSKALQISSGKKGRMKRKGRLGGLKKGDQRKGGGEFGRDLTPY